MIATKFAVGDLITVTKPTKSSMPFWNDSSGYNMDYLTAGVHLIARISERYVIVDDYRFDQQWTLHPDWCTLVNEAVKPNVKHYKVIRKIQQMKCKREEAGYAF
jgi:hypothetical protein